MKVKTPARYLVRMTVLNNNNDNNIDVEDNVQNEDRNIISVATKENNIEAPLKVEHIP